MASLVALQDKAVKEVKQENKMREDVLSTKTTNTEDETGEQIGLMEYDFFFQFHLQYLCTCSLVEYTAKCVILS